MSSLLGEAISTTYPLLLKVNEDGIDGTLRPIEDGLGEDSALLLATTGIKSSGTLTVVGITTLAATSFGEANITNVGDIALDSISADGTDINVAVSDNSATALTIKQGSDSYLIVDTANSSESITLGGVSGTAITLGHETSETTVSDNLTVTGTTTCNSNLIVPGDDIIIGGSDDAGDKTVQFRHDAVATIIGIDDTHDAFIINTDSAFDGTLANNSFSIDASHNIIGAGNLTIAGNLDIDGLSNLDAVDIDGAVQIDNTVTVGVNEAGRDVKFYGATSGQYMLWNQATDELVLTGDSKLSFHDAAGGENIVASSNGHLEINAGTTLDITAPTIDINAATSIQVDGEITVGVDDAGYDVKFFGNTAGAYFEYDVSHNRVNLVGSDLAETNLVMTGTTDIPIRCTSADTACMVSVKDNNSSSDAGMITYGENGSTNDKLDFRTNNISRLSMDESGLYNYQVAIESVTDDDALVGGTANSPRSDSGKLFVFADAGAVLTLPDSGAGDIIGTHFKFYSNFQGTGQKVVCADTTNEKLYGNLVSVHTDDDSAAAVPWNAAAGDSYSSVNFNSVAQGEPGSWFEVINIAADVWKVEGVVIQSGGSEATPFATT